jgi:glycosyltransferase involved in cell wall biosynthesis
VDWHLITGVYPPRPGGLSDYTHLVASGLAAAGEAVHVWCPEAGDVPAVPGVQVHPSLAGITPADLRVTGMMLDQFPGPRRLFVQWDPYVFGYRALNLPFCLWVWKRARVHRDRVTIVVHEAGCPFGKSWKQGVVAAAHRLMAMILLNAAHQVWVTIPAWERRWRPCALGRRIRFTWLPVPSTIPRVEDAPGVATIRGRYAPPNGMLLGHLGCYPRQTFDKRRADFLRASLRKLLPGHPDRAALLIGQGGKALHARVVDHAPDLAGQVYAVDNLAAADLSRHLSACDLMLQPYPDGVSTRRTSMMAALSHALAAATTTGPNTEALWEESGAASLTPAGDVAALAESAERLLKNEGARARMGATARALYRARFDVAHTVAALQGATSGVS